MEKPSLVFVYLYQVVSPWVVVGVDGSADGVAFLALGVAFLVVPVVDSPGVFD